MDQTTPSRRRFLALTAAGSGLGVAGCSELGDGEPAATDGETDGDGERRATMFVQPDQEAVQEARGRIGQRVQNDNLSQREIQQEFAEARQQLLSDAVAQMESELADRAVTVEETLEMRGALLVAGPATALIDLLSHDMVRSLVDAASFQELQTANGQGSG